ncbi:uncharacterized protein LOC113351343 [Papaver somniferum]|uniref:uncharacterized protein LOC113351343 n=1 Tax=Papaver somniferum TaxID=3469 RepID=UPI000E7013DD|nr:uncharacterized protein LOC113351343 [Papaver somniferum]
MVEKKFAKWVHTTLEVYVDDMLVKSKDSGDHVEDLKEIFEQMKKYEMKINPAKCIFGVESAKFLGHIVSRKGIEVDPAKVQAILEMSSPATGAKFSWTQECEKALQNIKEYWINLSILQKPEPGEELLICLAATPNALSAVLLRTDEGVEKPIFYVSKTLNSAERNYPKIEKLILALTSTKSHIIVEFLAEFPSAEDEGVKEMMDVDEGRLDPMDLLQEIHPRRWEIFVDGSSNSSGGAKYEAIVQALRIAIEMGLDDVRITSDSQLVVRQIEWRYNAVYPVMQKYLQLVKEYSAEIRSIIWRNIGRDNNRHADALAFIASMIEDPKIGHIRFERLMHPSVSKEDKELRVMIVEEGDMEVDDNDWRAPIYNYLTKGDLPRDRQEANKIKSKDTNYEAEWAGRLDRMADMQNGMADWMESGWQHIWQHGWKLYGSTIGNTALTLADG